MNDLAAKRARPRAAPIHKQAAPSVAPAQSREEIRQGAVVDPFAP